MIILGIETSCDDTAAAVIEVSGGFKKPFFTVLSNVSYSQVAIHKKFGGIVPNLASRAHLEKIILTIKMALLKSDVKKFPTSDVGIDLIAVTCGPGLAPSLLIGINTARALAYAWQKPILGINHIEGHIYSNWLPPVREFLISKSKFLNKSRIKNTKHQIPNTKYLFPALILIVSGGHTELVLMKGHGKYKIIGQTLDDAAGECFDKTARLLGLGFPGGPAIARQAEQWKSEIRNQKSETNLKYKIQNTKYRIKLPRPMINSKDYNFSFSGLKTAVLYLYNDLVKKYPKEKIISAMATEIQQAIVDVLVVKTLKAARNFNPKTVMIAGGVSANKKLREEMSEKLKSYKIPFFVPEFPYTTDNAAMIAAAGYFSSIGGPTTGGNYFKKRSLKDSWKKIEMNANLKL